MELCACGEVASDHCKHCDLPICDGCIEECDYTCIDCSTIHGKMYE